MKNRGAVMKGLKSVLIALLCFLISVSTGVSVVAKTITDTEENRAVKSLVFDENKNDLPDIPTSDISETPAKIEDKTAAKAPEKKLTLVNDEDTLPASESSGEVQSNVFTVNASSEKTLEDYIAEIVAGVNPEWSDLKKIIYLHDYLITHYDYDYTYTNRWAEDMFRYGTGVCQAYASAFHLLLRAVGISDDRVTSKEMNHVWNIVFLDGNWYHADCTWDDVPSSGHKYFLLSDEAMKEKDHTGWFNYSNIKCTDTKYDDFFWNDAQSQFAFDGETSEYYYVSAAEYKNNKGVTTVGYCIMKTDESFEKHDVVLPLKEIGNNSRWFSSYAYGRAAGIVAADGKLYFNNDSSIISYDLHSGELNCEMSLKSADLYIYDCYNTGDEIIYLFGDRNMDSTETAALSRCSDKGDINADGVIDNTDADLLRKYLAGGYGSIINHENSDIDGDGRLTMKDFSVLRRTLS